MMESESIALPLGDTPTGMGWIVGFEPTHNGATTRCLNHLTIPTMITCIRDISIPDQVIFGDPDRDRTDDLQRDRLAF